MYEQILYKILRTLQYTINENNEKHYDGYIRYSPYKHTSFSTELKLAMSHTDGKKFLDVGCGIADKCLIARDIFGLDAKGIELDNNLHNIAQRMMVTKEETNHIYNMDALDFTGYGKYDILYIYKPVSDERQMELETKIKNDMKIDTVLIAPLMKNQPNENFNKLSSNVWIKIGV